MSVHRRLVDIFTPPAPRRFDWGFRTLMAVLLAVAAGSAVGFTNPDALSTGTAQVDREPQAGNAAVGDARQHADCDQLHWPQPTPDLDQLAARELVELASVCGRYPPPAGAVR